MARDLTAQLDAIRAQALAIVATVDAIVGPPDERCCDAPKPKTVETYTTRTVFCENCKTILSKVSLGPGEEKRGEDHA